MAYQKCPRCSLNYMKDTDVLCKICLTEVGKAIRSNDEEEEEYDICPECGEHIIKAGEEMCYQCIMEQVKEEVAVPVRKDEVWNDDFVAQEDEDGEVFDGEEEDETLTEIELDLEDDPDVDLEEEK